MASFLSSHLVPTVPKEGKSSRPVLQTRLNVVSWPRLDQGVPGGHVGTWTQGFFPEHLYWGIIYVLYNLPIYNVGFDRL